MNTVTLSPIGSKSQFDYGNIPEALQNEAEAVVSSVRVSLGKINTQALELARQIHRIQEQFQSRQFKAWLNYYFPDAESQIRNWLKIVELAERLPEYIEQMMGWGASAIAALSSGSDELAKSVLSGSKKLSKAAIKALISEEREESQPPASSSSTETDSKLNKQQVSEIAIQLAKLTAHKVELQKQLTQSVTPEAEEQLRYHIRQAELEIQQLCEEFDPAQIGVAAMIQQRTQDSNVNTESEEFQRLRSQLESEQRNKAELLERIEKLEQEQYPSVDVNFSESEEFQKMQSLTIELRSHLQAEKQDKAKLLERIEQLEQEQYPSVDVNFSESEEFQKMQSLTIELRSQLESEQRNKAELLSRIEQLEQQQSPSVEVNFSESSEFQKMQSLTIELRSQKSELINRIQQLENQLTQQQSPSAEVDFSESSEYQYFQSLTAELKSHLQAERQKSVELSKQLEQLQQQFAQQQRSSQNAEAISSDSQEFKRMRSLAVELQSQKAKLSNRVQQLERQLVQKQQFPKADLKLSESEELKRMRSLAVELQSQKAQLSNRVQQLEQQQSNGVEVNLSESEELQSLRSQLESERQSKAELSERIEKLEIDQCPIVEVDFSESEEFQKMRSLTVELRSQLESERQSKAELSERIEKLEIDQCPIVEVDFSESEEYQKMRSLTVELRSQLESERQSKAELLERIEKLEQEQYPNVEVNFSESEELQRLQSQLETKQRQITELAEQLEHLNQYFTQQHKEQIQTRQQQLQEKEEFITQLQKQQIPEQFFVFRPQFTPVTLSELKLNDRIRAYAPDGKKTVDDMIIGFDKHQQPRTKWLGVLTEAEVEADWKFERMEGTEKVHAQLSQFQEDNSQLREQVAHLEAQLNLRKYYEEHNTALAKRIEKKQKFRELILWQERLQNKVQTQLKPGAIVEVLYDSKGISTGLQGTIVQEFECSPGEWWVSFFQPHTQASYRSLFPAYQLYLVEEKGDSESSE